MPEDRSAEGASEEGGAASSAPDLRLTDTQRQILAALCLPREGGSHYATPATNQAIAAAVFLSVDAVKAHLRVLYRKFGVEPLPHNQKRARLVELVVEGGYLESGLMPQPDAEAPSPKAPPRSRSRIGRRTKIAGSAIALGVAGVAAALLLADDSAEESPAQTLGKTEHVSAIDGYCSLALGGHRPVRGENTAERAGGFLGVIAILGDRLDTLPAPEESSPAFDRFLAGLGRAAEFTSRVAEEPPEIGTRASENTVAQLTIAAGQVQTGALGYGLGPDCRAIGDLVNSAAANAARGP